MSIKKWLVILLFCFSLWSIGAVSAETDTPTIPQDTPEVVTTNSSRYWTVQAGFVYWADNCWSQEFIYDSYIKRRPTGGSSVTTMGYSTVSPCLTYFGLGADENGVYYFDSDNSRIEKRDTSTPYTEQTVATVDSTTSPNAYGMMTPDSTHVYWPAYDNTIKRALKSGGSPETVVSTGTAMASDIVVTSSDIYWGDINGLHKISKSCALPCTTITDLDLNGNVNNLSLGKSTGLFNSFNLYYVANGKEYISGDVVYYSDTIMRYSCGFVFTFPTGGIQYTCDTSEVYQTTTNNFVSKVSSSTSSLFWMEYNQASAEVSVKRKTGSTIEDIYLSPNLYYDNRTFTDNNYVYFRYNNGIGRLAINAAPIIRTYVVDNWEITQAIQNLANGVPLVARKPTVVRVYGRLTAGPQANNVPALLYGMRNGSPLPGSPLSSVNGGEALSPTYVPNRSLGSDGWMFELPESWTSIGTTNLEVRIDPNHLYAPNHTSSTRNAVFTDEPASCLIYLPVRTHNPLPNYSSANVWPMIDRYTDLWPVPRTRTYWQSEPVEELQVCWWGPFPYPCYGPYELQEGWSIGNGMPDKDKAMASIMARAIFSDDPDECDADGGSVHYVGMVHRDANTGSTTGYANYLIHASWVKNPPSGSPSTSWAWPRQGGTLAQETTHNFWRLHVNCGGPGDLDNNYPYPGCQLDNTGNANHFGFDVSSRTPIPPQNAADYMSYANNLWVSDYTYKAVKNQFSVVMNRDAAQSPAGVTLAQAAKIVMVSGAIEPELMEGVLNYSYVMDTAALSAGILAKFQTLAAEKYTFQRSAEAPSYHIQLLDSAGTVLDDRAITLNTPDHHGELDQFQPFYLSFPAPAGAVAKIELLADTTVLAERKISMGSPVVSILNPMGGTTITGDFIIEWDGSDPDANDPDNKDVLMYNISYSSDNGLHWQSLVNDYIGNPTQARQKFILSDPTVLAGSNGATALIRIIASDGYNSTTATSELFTVPNHSPIPYIIAPVAGHSYAAGQAVPAKGDATDPEDGGVADDNLIWAVDGMAMGTGRIASFEGLAPGTHKARLTAIDSVGNEDSAESTFQIAPLTIPSGSASELDGDCNDAAYANGVSIALAPYSDGTQATATLLRHGSYLQLCFSNLMADGSSSADIRIDANASGDNIAQVNDYAFSVDEMGTPVDLSGDGLNGFENPGPDGLMARIAEGTLGYWSAEMWIDSAVFGGWEHLIQLQLGHSTSLGRVQWPYNSQEINPSTWGATQLGNVPQVDSVNPTAGISGQPLELTIAGSDFPTTTKVFWDGAPIATTFVTTMELKADVPATATTGAHKVTVRLSAESATDSAPFTVDILNPVPMITMMNPVSVTANSGDFTLLVDGSNFVPGAQIVWNGQQIPTTFVNNSQLKAMIYSTDLTVGGEIGVAVQNPELGGGASEDLRFSIDQQTSVPTSVNTVQQQSTSSNVALWSILTLGMIAIATFGVMRRHRSG